MNIYNCQFGFGNEVEGQISYNIYLSGCKNNKNCPMDKCHNPELRNFDVGFDWEHWKQKIIEQTQKQFFTCFCLLGGEPLDQDEEQLLDFLSFLNAFSLPIYIYTGYDENILIEKCMNIHSLVKGIYFGSYVEGSLNSEHKELLLFCKE